MRILTSFVTCTTLMAAALMGCVDPSDPFDTVLTTATTATTMTGDGDGDTSTGDGDGDTTGPADTETGNECVLGAIGDPCDDTCGCAEGLTCDGTMTCSLGGGDGDGDSGDGDGDTGGECDTYDPMLCMPPGMLLGVMDVPGNFCGCPCVGNEDCPMGPPGTTGACALSTMGGAPEYCALVCTPGGMMDACPAPSTCNEVPSQPGVGLCTYPE